MSQDPETRSRQSPPESEDQRPSLCVINYNGESYLEDCLSAALAVSQDLREIVVVDNASDDGSLDLLAERFPTVRLIALDQNDGPAVARNVALKEAESDRVLLIDNDVSLEGECVLQLADALSSNERAAVAMPAVIYRAQRDLVQYDGAQSHYLGMMSIENEDVPVADLAGEVREIGSVISACILVDRSMFPTYNLFNEAFFIYQEDHDFGYRTRALGLKVLSVPSARCLHGAGTDNLSIRSLGKYSERRVFYLIRNRWLFLLNNYSLKTLLILSPMALPFELSQLLVSIKKGWLGPWLEAVGSVISMTPRTLASRRVRQEERQVPDGELVCGGPIPFRSELTTSGLERRARQLLDSIVVTYWRGVGSWL